MLAGLSECQVVVCMLQLGVCQVQGQEEEEERRRGRLR